MDEEGLDQPKKKITIGNFFESISSASEMAQRAFETSNTNSLSIKASEDTIKGIQTAIETIQNDVQQITNYLIVQSDQATKAFENREQEFAERRDLEEKKGRKKQEQLKDIEPFAGSKGGFLQNLAKGAEDLADRITPGLLGINFAFALDAFSRMAGFEDGGDPPIGIPSIVGESGPEIFVPKQQGTIIPNNKKINTQALLNTISVAEGTAKGGYGTIYGGTDDDPIVVPELAEGKMTINQVLNMMKTGKIERTRMVENEKGEMVEEKYMADVGYGKENNVGATGRYQFIPAALEEEVNVMMKKDKSLSLNSLFTPQLQDKLIIQRLKEKRKIDFDKLEKEGITTVAIDKLSEEFESFPNLLPGPRKYDLGPNEGRTDQSFYDVDGTAAPVRSEDFIKSVFETEVENLTPPDEDLISEVLPAIGDIGDGPMNQGIPPFTASNIMTDELTTTVSNVPFIRVIENDFLSTMV